MKLCVWGPDLGGANNVANLRETAVIRHGLGILLLLLRPLVSRDGSGANVDGGGGRRVKGKSANPPGLGRCQQCGNKGENAVILFIVFAVGLYVDGQGWWWGVKNKPCIGSVPGPGLCSLVSSILLLTQTEQLQRRVRFTSHRDVI